MTRFQFEFEYLQSIANVKLIEPRTNRTYSIQNSDSCIQKFLKINEKISGEVVCIFNNPARGLWTVLLHNPYYGDLTAHFTVTSYFDREKTFNPLLNNFVISNNDITEVEASWKHSILSYPSMQAIYVSVKKAFRPILNATVQAIIYRPIGEPLILDLYDDGLFCDRFKNDGIYSRYFLAFNSNGPYTAQVSVFYFFCLEKQSSLSLLYFQKIIVSTTETTTVHKKKLAGTQSTRTIHPHLKIYNLLNEALVEPIFSFERSLSVGSFLLHDYIGILNYKF